MKSWLSREILQESRVGTVLAGCLTGCRLCREVQLGHVVGACWLKHTCKVWMRHRNASVATWQVDSSAHALACMASPCRLHAVPMLLCRTSKNTVMLSNVTLWVPAAEFSFIRSHTGEQPATFTINLQGKHQHMHQCLLD